MVHKPATDQDGRVRELRSHPRRKTADCLGMSRDQFLAALALSGMGLRVEAIAVQYPTVDLDVQGDLLTYQFRQVLFLALAGPAVDLFQLHINL